MNTTRSSRFVRTMHIGVVGLGYWGPNLLRVLMEHDHVEVSWLCDHDEVRLERFGVRHPTARQTTSFEDLLEDPVLDAVVIATPIFTHADMATRALRVGKHVFVEKPLATSVDEADRLQELADECGRTLMCGHTFLFSPPVQYVKSMLDDGELGDLYFISSSRVNLGLHQRDVSVIWDLGPHDFSIILNWLGELPESVRAVGRAAIVPGIPDVAFVTLRYPTGLLINIELSWLSPSKLRRTVLVGSKKMVVYEDGALEPVRVYDSGVVYRDPETFGEYHLSYRTGDIVSPRLRSNEPLAEQMDQFVAAARRGASMPEHAKLARDVVLLLEAADRSLFEGGTDIAVANGLVTRA
jgi:predicted dehydrogenase